MRFLALFIAVAAAFAQNPAFTISIDAAANRKTINPDIYGLSVASASALSDLNVTLNRQGGNNTTRYNWQANADNRANDWYYESFAYSSATPGEVGDTFIQTSKSSGAQPMITIPMAGYVAKLGANRGKLASFSQAKYGAMTDADWQWYPDAGNGILASTGKPVVGNDPLDANVPADSAFQAGWVQAIVNRWGLASANGLKYYIFDNEPSIWHATHRDIHPTGAKMAEIRDKMIDYADRIKRIDPGALTVGPEEWGWTGYLLSGYDQQYASQTGNWSTPPDKVANGNMDYLPWLLSQLKTVSVAGGLKPLDVFTVHYYPQGGEFSNDVSTSMQLLRNKSTRSLWDPTYVDQSWIGTQVYLIPRMRGWADTHYFSGTPIGITEYNWGAEGHINGATTQADILGIFGREGLNMGTRWTTPDASTPTYKAIKMYRNYDGAKSTFGDTSVKTTVPNPDNVSAFSALRTSDGALTVMVINKYLNGSTPVTLNLGNFAAASPAKVYQLTSSNAITRLADLSFTGSTLSATVPQQSITLFVLPKSGGNASPTAVISANPTSGQAPLAVSFSGAGSTDSDGTIASYAWVFGDGATGSGVTASHTYAAAGTFTAQLTVTDNLGATGTASVQIQVSATGLAAPSNLVASGGRGAISLTWTDNSNNETGFYIERASSGGTFARIAQVGSNATSYTDTGLAKGQYSYRVQAFNATATSTYSNTASGRAR